VVNDNLAGNRKLRPAFNLWSLTESVRHEGKTLEDGAPVSGPLHLAGQWGVDLDVFIARPRPARIHLGELGYRARRYDREFRRLHGRKFEERQILVRVHQKPGGSFTVAVFPRKPDGPEPAFSRLRGVPGLRLRVAGQTHRVILSAEPVTYRSGPLRFKGTAAVVKEHADGSVELCLLAPGRISYGELSLRKAPGTVRGEP
jgi:hypothetical protein